MIKLREAMTCALSVAVFLSSLSGGGSVSAVAQEMTEALPSVMPTDVIYNGSFSQRIEFKVPGQRGLEPRLGLSYDSGSVNAYGADNLVGAGWRLSGLSSIQRTNFRRAVPRFNDQDIWLLDGQELVPCGSYTGAACGAGATHATRIENYQRVKKVSGDNTWEVTSRDGTKYVYKPLRVWAQSATVPLSGTSKNRMLDEYRYLLAEKVDTLGRKVTFNYACGADLDCRIQTVAYDIGQIKFHWETRPDVSTYAAGYMLGKTATRLRTVEIKSAGQMLRTYELTYTASPATGRSLLASVTERGRNSVVGSGGVVSAGTALPPHVFQYTGAESEPIQVADLAAEEALPRYGNPAGGRYQCGKFGSDKKVHCIVRDSSNRLMTTEDPPRHVYNYTNNYTIWTFYFIRETHSAQRKVVTVPGNYTSTGSERRFKHDSRYGRPRLIADFDGDGLDDITGADGSPVKQRYTSSESAGSWGGFGEGGNSAADLNGDGLTDIYDPEGSHTEFHLSNGKNSFDHVYNHSLSPSFGEYRRIADFNGDGTADFMIANNNSGSYRLYYTVGNTMVTGPSFTLPGTCISNCVQPNAVDANGDGKADIIANLPSGKAVLYLNRGNSFEVLKKDGSNYEFNGKYVSVGDVDENGVSEIIKEDEFWKGGFGAARWSLQTEQPDLLNVVKSPLGAETKVTYEVHKPSANSDFPLSLTVVKSLEAYDGRSVRAKTDYAYAGEDWNWKQRQFLGFEKITATLPPVVGQSGRPVVETTYMQDMASVGKVKEVLHKDGSGRRLQKRVETYDVQASTKPYTSLNTETVVTTYYDGTPKSKREVRTFNAFGLVHKRIQHGDTAKTGDEWIHTRWPYPNKDKYIVNRIAVEAINSGTGYHYTDNRQWRRWHYYDGANDSIKEVPAKGLRTKTSEWTGGAAEDKIVQVVSTYDAQGNLLTEADGLANTTTYSYDSPYKLFPVEIRNPLYGTDPRHKRLLTWDKVCGVVTKETDENGAQTTHTYDNLCRKTQTNLPGGGRVKFSYNNWGNPTASYNRTQTLHPNGAGDIVQDVYFDGFGRTYIEETSNSTQDTGTLDTTARKLPFVANAIPDQSAKEKTAWSFVVPANSFSDADGDLLSYSAFLSDGSSLPAWLSFNTTTRTFSGTPPVGARGNLPIRVLASDGTGAAEDQFNLTIATGNNPVVASPIADKKIDEGTSWSFTIPADSFTDVDGDALVYTATLSDGSPLPSWLSFNGATRTFTSSPPNRGAAVKVTASDGGVAVEDTFNVVARTKETRVNEGWGIRAFLTRGYLTLVSDTDSISANRKRHQNPYHVTVKGGNARITRFDFNDGKICTFQYIDLHEERYKEFQPNGGTTYTGWTSVEEVVRPGEHSCG